MACIAVASASSIMSQAWVIFCGELVYTSVLSTLVTVWCILSQIALDCKFLLVEHTSLMLKISNSHWKFCLMNTPPLSCRHHTGWGYRQSQLSVNLSRMCLAVLLSTWISLTRFEAISMQVNALNSTCWPLTLTFHGPIKLMATSPRVQSAPLVWVGDHNHGLLTYAFGNLCTSISQCDSAIWGNHNIGSTSLVISFHQDVLLLGGIIWQYQLPLIQATQFFNRVEWDLSYNRWCHQGCHPVVSWHNCLDISLVEQAAVPPVAAIHECVHNSMDSHPDVECQVIWDSTQCIPRHPHPIDQSILDPRNTIHLLPQ